MHKTQFNNLPIWQFENLSTQNGIKHFVSCREGGFSKDELGALNLSYKVNDDPELVTRNRNKLADAFGIDHKKLIFPVQTHSNHVKIVTSTTSPSELEDTDAIITAEKGVLISVMSADCVPIILYDPKKAIVASIHAGWRGTMAEILRVTIEKMKIHFDTNSSDLIASIGPSISGEVYEVGEEVINATIKVYGSTKGIINKENNGKGFCDLWEANRIQLVKAGVKEDKIEVAGLCTFKNAEEFFSFRKYGNKAGRFAAGIMLV